MSDRQCWWLAPQVRVHVKFRYGGMTQEDYDVWVVEESKALQIAEVPELYRGVAGYGYDLFDVAWLNLWWHEDEFSMNNSWHSLIIPGSKVFTKPNQMVKVVASVEVEGQQLDIIKKVMKPTVRFASQEDLDRLESNKKPNYDASELAEREAAGESWMTCAVADEAYAVDYTTRQEQEAWKAHAFMVEQSHDDEVDVV